MEKEKKPFKKKYIPYAVVASIAIVLAAGGIYASVGNQEDAKKVEPKQVVVQDGKKATKPKGPTKVADPKKPATIGSIFARVEEKTTGHLAMDVPAVANSPVADTWKQLALVPEEKPVPVIKETPHSTLVTPTVNIPSQPEAPIVLPEKPVTPEEPVTPVVPTIPEEPDVPALPEEPVLPEKPVDPPVIPDPPIVVNQQPTIEAQDRTLHVGENFEPFVDVTATDPEDGDLTSRMTILFSDVDTTKEGIYHVTYEVVDSQQGKGQKTITITIINDAPEIQVEDQTITVGAIFDSLVGVTASDTEDGDVTSRVEVMKNDVDTATPGVYEVSYRVIDSHGKSSGWITIHVTVQEAVNEAPVIIAQNRTIAIGETPDWLQDVTAIDAEDGDITAQLKVDASTVDMTIEGVYLVTYTVSDSQGNQAQITVEITVIAASEGVEHQ